jgi:hypothetical protein
MKKNGRKAYLSDLLGCPLDNGADTVINFYNRARPSLVFPKRDTNLVPYEELSLYVFQADLNACRLRRVEFDNEGSIVFVYLTDRARLVHEGPFQNSYPISPAP